MSKPFYITTTLPYVNSDPHVGFAMELVRADIIARSHALAGQEVFFNTGTDEHGVKIYRKAKEQGVDAQTYVDGYAARFKELCVKLDIAGASPESAISGLQFNFIRTTDAHHKAAAQAFWKLVEERGKADPRGPFIYKKQYAMKYCVGCELEKTDSELVNGRCPLHPLMELEIINEENYFFKLSAFKDDLLGLYERNPGFVIPAFRLNEVQQFVSRGLTDISISRLASKMPWGVPVPGDADHVMYVWFDALVNYISAIGWPGEASGAQSDSSAFKKWWIESGGVVQYCGKDNLRQQSLTWQSMLLAAGLSPSQTIVIDGFVTGEGGLKMSKSLGNVVDPFAIISEYGADALRYYVARELSPFEDSPFTMDKFKEAYNAHLANGIGNLTSRIMKLAETNLDGPVAWTPSLPEAYIQAMKSFDIKAACDCIWSLIQAADARIQQDQPFKVVKTDPAKGKELIADLVKELANISHALRPILPRTAAAVLQCVAENKMPAQPLFLRK